MHFFEIRCVYSAPIVGVFVLSGFSVAVVALLASGEPGATRFILATYLINSSQLAFPSVGHVQEE